MILNIVIALVIFKVIEFVYSILANNFKKSIVKVLPQKRGFIVNRLLNLIGRL